jgi:hypothetical protein
VPELLTRLSNWVPNPPVLVFFGIVGVILVVHLAQRFLQRSSESEGACLLVGVLGFQKKYPFALPNQPAPQRLYTHAIIFKGRF